MNCRSFRMWLEHAQEADAPGSAAAAHAASCARCAALLRAAVEVEAFLASIDQSPPADFTDRVLRRLPPRAASPRPVTSPDSVVRRPAPSRRAELAAIGITLLGTAPVVMSWAVAAGAAFSRTLGQLVRSTGSEGAFSHDPTIRLALALMLLPAVLFASRILFRWTAESIAGGALVKVVRAK